MPVFVREALSRARVCVRERERERERERKLLRIFNMENFRCSNKMLNSDKTMDFARFGGKPLSELTVSESGSSRIWKELHGFVSDAHS